MRTWASWTAKAALLAAGFAAAGGGLSGAALAASSGSAGAGAGTGSSAGQLITPTGVCSDAGALLGVVGVACQPGATASLPAAGGAETGWPGTGNAPSGSGPASGSRSPLPADACGSAAAVLGDSTAGCLSGALAGATTGRPASGGPASGGPASSGTVSGGAGGMVQRMVAPAMSVLGATAPLGASGPLGTRPLAGLQPRCGLAPLSAAAGGHPAAPGADSASVNPPGADAGAGAGDTNVPAVSLAGLGALPGLADLPSLAGLATMPALSGDTGGSVPMPGSALSAANTSGMSSDSFAALAVGALLAGASALKIAGRRARDRKAGIGVAI